MNSDLMMGLILATCSINFMGLLFVGVRMEMRGNRAEALDKRLTVLEQTIRSVPTHTDLAALRDRIGGISGQIAGLSDRHQSSAEMIRSIQHHLMRLDS